MMPLLFHSDHSVVRRDVGAEAQDRKPAVWERSLRWPHGLRPAQGKRHESFAGTRRLTLLHHLCVLYSAYYLLNPSFVCVCLLQRQQVVMTEQLAKTHTTIHFSVMHPGWVDTPGILSGTVCFSKSHVPPNACVSLPCSSVFIPPSGCQRNAGLPPFHEGQPEDPGAGGRHGGLAGCSRGRGQEPQRSFLPGSVSFTKLNKMGGGYVCDCYSWSGLPLLPDTVRVQ